MTGAATNQLSDNGVAYFNLSDVIVKEFKNNPGKYIKAYFKYK